MKIIELKKNKNQKAYDEGFLSGTMDEELKELKNQTEAIISKKKNKDKILTNDSLWAIAVDGGGRGGVGYLEIEACDNYYKECKANCKKFRNAITINMYQKVVLVKRTIPTIIPIMITNQM